MVKEEVIYKDIILVILLFIKWVSERNNKWNSRGIGKIVE